MKKQDKVRVEICGRSFFLTSGDEPKYLIKIAEQVNKSVSDLMKNNVGVSFEQAIVLTALKYCDDFEKNNKQNETQTREDEQLGRRLVEYSKELTRATAKIKSLEKELNRYKKEYGEL